jgi:hypothetical protein
MPQILTRLFQALRVLENVASGDTDVDAGRLQRSDILVVHAPVDLDEAGGVETVSQRLETADLLIDIDELLSAEARVDAHDEHHVDVGQQVLDALGRSMRVQDDRRFDAEAADILRQAVRVLLLFDMKGDIARLQRGEEVDEEGVVLHHEVHIQRLGRGVGDRGDDDGADGQVRDEMAVHHINVDEVASGIADGADVACEVAEIGGENTGGYEHGRALSFLTPFYRIQTDIFRVLARLVGKGA